MGLKCSPHGVKAQLKDRFPQAFREYATLADARDAAGVGREQCVSVLDGNVLLHGVPASATTLDAYVGIVYSALLKACATCFLTVVVLDDPATLTEAKRQEQARRDAARRPRVVCSADVPNQAPTNDDYDAEQLARVQNVHSLVSSRGSRMRFFDEVMRVVLDRLGEQIKRWNGGGFLGGNVIVDGLDGRGALRNIGASRAPAIVGTCPELTALFQREEPIGEGDLKLAFAGRRFRELAAGGHAALQKTKLALTSTIDTDSFAIELLQEAQRVGDAAASPVQSLLCMRENTKKRGTADEKSAVYLCCDLAMLHEKLQAHMHGLYRTPAPLQQRTAMALLAAGWALCGCDFVEVAPARRLPPRRAAPAAAAPIHNPDTAAQGHAQRRRLRRHRRDRAHATGRRRQHAVRVGRAARGSRARARGGAPAAARLRRPHLRQAAREGGDGAGHHPRLADCAAAGGLGRWLLVRRRAHGRPGRLRLCAREQRALVTLC